MAAGTDIDARLTACIAIWDDYVRLVPRAVARLREQLPPNELEILVVDNASTAPVPKLADVAVLRRRKRVTLGAARNAGLEAVTTPYVCFVDVDDELRPGVLVRCVIALDAAPDAAAVVTRMVGRDGRLFPSDRALAFAEEDPEAFRRFCTERHLFCVNNGTVFRTAAVRAVGGYGDLALGSDVVVSATIGFAGDVLFDRFVGHEHETRPDSLSGRPVEREALLAAKAAVRRRLRELHCVPPDVKADLSGLARRHRRNLEENWRPHAIADTN